MTRAVLLVVLLVVLLAACGGSTHAAPTSITTTTAAPFDPCDLLSIPEVEAATGATVTSVITNDTNPSRSRCTWSLDSGAIAVVLYGPEISRRIFDGTVPDERPIADIGDGASWTERGRAITFIAGDRAASVELTVDPHLDDELGAASVLALAVLGRL